MNTFEFLSYLRRLDIKLFAEGEQLRCSAPKGALTPTLQAELAERKAEFLLCLHQMNVDTRSALPPIFPVSRDGTLLPLSFAQQRLWFLNQWEPGNPAYNIPLAYRITGQLAVAALKQSLGEIVKRHEILRTTFAALNAEPVQIIAPDLVVTLPLTDLRELPATDREVEAQRLATEEARRPFDLAQGPLMRVGLLRLADEE